ncbi:MAG: alcohol dehydrogenase [Gemmatimonas sp.]|nr:alcohol dehydrogenase [Gemmatimonas sp.]
MMSLIGTASARVACAFPIARSSWASVRSHSTPSTCRSPTSRCSSVTLFRSDVMSLYRMRALTFTEHGGPEQLVVRDDIAMPTIDAADSVRVRLVAAALNRLDLWVLGGIPGSKVKPGWPLGSDGAGIVEAVGSGVTRVKPGDRVIINPGVADRSCQCEYCRDGDQPLCLSYGILGEHLPGTLAEYVVVPEANLRTFPDWLPWETAAAFPLATLTAWRMVVTRAKVRAGDQVLIWGIGGGVALAALQICKHLGATVWVTSSSPEKLDKAQLLGADHLLDHRQPDVGKTIRARTDKRGVDVVIDSVGEATWAQSLTALGRRGRLVTCGGTSGPFVQVDVRRMFWNQWTLMGSTMGNDAEFGTISDFFDHGSLQPPVDSVWSLDEAQAAYARLASGQQFGKVVIRLRGQAGELAG